MKRIFKSFYRNFSSQRSENSLLLFSKLNINGQKIALIELNNPTKRNALSNSIVQDLDNLIKEMNNDLSIRVGILRSKIPNMFCSGADLKERKGLSNEESELLVINLRKIFDNFYHLPFPTIACIDGFALGGGLELAISCDMRIASKNSIIGLPETSLGLIPGAGGTQKLARIIGVAKAKELIFTSERFSAKKALEYGILNYVEDNYDSTYSKALEISEKIIKNAPIAVRQAKTAINFGTESDLRTGLEIEKMLYSRLCYTEDRVEALNAFAEKRKPNFKGK